MIDTTQSRVSCRTPMKVSNQRKCGVAKHPSIASQLPFQSSLPIWAMKAWPCPGRKDGIRKECWRRGREIRLGPGPGLGCNEWYSSGCNA